MIDLYDGRWHDLPLSAVPQHFPPGSFPYDSWTGTIEYPPRDDRRAYLWPMVVDLDDHKMLFVDGPQFVPTVYFHLNYQDCTRLRWALMFRRDKVWGLGILLMLLVSGACNIWMAVHHFGR